MERRHRSILYTLVLLILVFQLTAFVFSSIQFSKAHAKIDSEISRLEENLSSQFTNALNEYDALNQRNFNELSIAIAQQAAQQKTFEEQIDVIKSTKEDFTGVIEDVLKSVVAVMTESSVGSGFFVSKDGYVLTNYHVIQKGDNPRILTYDKVIYSAKVVGVDKLRDLAILKIEADNINYLGLADSDKLQVGRKVIAIGNPLGLSFTVTEGIISGLERAGPNGIEEYIQTDVSLNPGNSGGPLINTQGEVVGMNNFKIGGAESLGFALESNAIKNSVNSLLEQAIIK